MQIQNFKDFTDALLSCGFSMGGGNAGGIFAVVDHAWDEQPPIASPIKWHTGNMDTDPWEWRMRVLDERDDIAYSKVFFGTSGYITREWYPYFIAARRGNAAQFGIASFEDSYRDGTISHCAKRIYDLLQDGGKLPLHTIKQLAGFTGADKSKFDRALVELQMGLFITMCGRQQKISQSGEAYGWSSTVFCTTEHFWGDEVFEEAAKISKQAAFDRIAEQIYRLNPDAEQKRIKKFICG